MANIDIRFYPLYTRKYMPSLSNQGTESLRNQGSIKITNSSLVSKSAELSGAAIEMAVPRQSGLFVLIQTLKILADGHMLSVPVQK